MDWMDSGDRRRLHGPGQRRSARLRWVWRRIGGLASEPGGAQRRGMLLTAGIFRPYCECRLLLCEFPPLLRQCLGRLLRTPRKGPGVLVPRRRPENALLSLGYAKNADETVFRVFGANRAANAGGRACSSFAQRVANTIRRSISRNTPTLDAIIRIFSPGWGRHSCLPIVPHSPGREECLPHWTHWSIPGKGMCDR